MKSRGVRAGEIARRLGVSPSAVSKALRPDAARVYNARTVERRDRERKRATDRAYEETHRHPCMDCGRPVKRGVERCQECIARHFAVIRQEALRLRRDELLTNVEIARRLGTTRHAINSLFFRLNREGVDIGPSPYWRRSELSESGRAAA